MKYLIPLVVLFMFGCIEDHIREIMNNPTTTKVATVRNNCEHDIAYSVKYDDGYSRTFCHNDDLSIDFQNIENRKIESNGEDVFVWGGSVLLRDVLTLYSGDKLQFSMRFPNSKEFSYSDFELLRKDGYFDDTLRAQLNFDDGTARLYIEICPGDSE